MKILHIITKSEMGGAQRHVFDQAKNSKQDITVVCGGNGELLKKLKEANIKTYSIPTLSNSPNPIKIIKFLKELRKPIQDADIVHCHSTVAGFWGRLLGKYYKKKTVFTAHGFAFKEKTMYSPLYLLIELIASYATDLVIAVSKEDEQLAKKYKLGKKIVYIPNGVEYKNKKPKENKRAVIGAIAHFYKNKGLLYLIKACNTLDIETRIIGDGPLRRDLEENASKNIRFLGSKVDVQKEMEKLDIIVLPSLKEGMPYVLLDAAAQKKAVIVTKVGAMPDIVKKNGIIVPPADTNALRKAIQKLATNRTLRKQYGEELYKTCEKEYSLKKMLKSTEKAYKTLEKERTNVT